MARAKQQNPEKMSGNPAAKETVRDNALAKVQNIINSPKFAELFFLVEMAPKMAVIAEGYNRSFNLELTPEDVASFTYLACWEDDWAKLRSFKGDTTPHAWVAKIASQATYKFLVEEKFIDGVGKTKTNDYRLTLLSIEEKMLRKEIVNMVYVPEMRKALELRYVDKVSDTDLVKVFSNADDAAKWLKEGENTLIEQLLNTENPYAEMALSLKKAINPETPWQVWHDRIDEGDVSENHQEFRNILSRLYNNEDWDDNVRNLVKDIIASLDWDERDVEVWEERFFYETPSKELAERFNVRNTWIDNRYSRLNKQFRIAVKSWWNANSGKL